MDSDIILIAAIPISFIVGIVLAAYIHHKDQKQRLAESLKQREQLNALGYKVLHNDNKCLFIQLPNGEAELEDDGNSMTVDELRDYIASLTGHVMFEYNGKPCGIDPWSLDEFAMWCGSDKITVDSPDKVLTTKLFDGKSLVDIWGDITDLDY